MKLSEFKQNIKERVGLLQATIVYSFQRDTAYWTENWAGAISMFFYMVSMLIFLEVIYANVDAVAGYARDEMLFFLFVGELNFVFSWMVQGSFRALIKDVNSGNLDLILAKPIPSQFYLMIRDIHILTLLRDVLPSAILITLVIDWSLLGISALVLPFAITIFILGLIAANSLYLVATIPVFWLGESETILSLFEHLEYNGGRLIPLEGYSTLLKTTFVSLLPVAIATAATTSVLLGKIDPVYMLLSALAVTMGFLIIRHLLWQKALMAYTSASS